MVEIDRRLAEVARRQRMMVTMADVRRAGGGRHLVTTRLESGRWRRVAPGVYLINGAPFGWEERLLAAQLAAGPAAVVSHLAAARVKGYPGFDHAAAELSVPRGQRFRRPGVRVHESTDLDRCRVQQRGPFRVTDDERTVLDLARYLGPVRLAKLVEWLRREGRVSWGSLLDTLVEHARPGRHGVVKLRQLILDEAGRRTITDTEAERLLLVAMRLAGLPDPEVHFRVETPSGRFVAEVDFAHPALKIAIEVMGSIHDLPEVRRKDAPRRNDLEIEGWLVLDYWNETVKDDVDRPVGEVRDAIAARSR